MEAAGYFVLFNTALIILAMLILAASIFTNNTNKALHMVYLSLAVLAIGLSIITTFLLANLGGNVGAIDKLILFGPSLIVVCLLVLPIKKSFNVKQ